MVRIYEAALARSSDFSVLTTTKGLNDKSVARVRARPHVQNQPKVLRIFIDAKEHIARADSGFVKNIVSKSLVTREKWEIRREPEDLKDLEMGSGTYTRSIGRVRVLVQLPAKTLQSPEHSGSTFMNPVQ